MVYQTLYNNLRQDTRSPMVIDVALGPETMRHLTSCQRSGGLSSGIVGVIRRFDLQCLQIAVGPVGNQSLTALRLPQLSFSYTLDHTCLHIAVYRKGLPVSKAHGAAAFVLAFYFVGTGEMVVTRPFLVASKQPAVKRTKVGPKRHRGPPPRQVHVVATSQQLCKEEEDAHVCIDALLARAGKRQKVDDKQEEPQHVSTVDSLGDDTDLDWLFSDRYGDGVDESIDHVSV